MRLGILVLAAVTAAAPALPARAGSAEDCFGENIELRLVGCTELIQQGAPPEDLAQIYAMRGLAFSLKNQYADAIADYDQAIALVPDFAIALNNRAWAHVRHGQPARGLADIEKAIRLSPTNPQAYDTRAHIRQFLGDAAGAVKDYEQALQYGGDQMVRLYQCGLAMRGLYRGPADGLVKPELQQALATCAADRQCDPLPPDEKCP